MSACQIEEYQDAPQARDELIPWLSRSDGHRLDTDTWRRRLAHWWDDNPFSPQCRERGWLLRHETRIVGFLGLIPACYAVEGRAQPAFIASTWRIDEEHRNASLPMLMKLRRLGAEAVIADSTPTPRVQELLERTGWNCLKDIRRRFVPLGLLARLPLLRPWPSVPAGCRVTHDPADVRSIAAPCMASAGIEKWVTPEYLRWFAASPMREHRFIGAVDDAGCLSSYLFLARKRVRGIPAWMEIDHFTTRGSFDELHALVGEVVRHPGLLGSERLLSLASFPGDPAWDEVPSVYQRQEQLCHCFAIPPSLKHLPKRTVLAEGDWGL